jgi:small GTP-binding protein
MKIVVIGSVSVGKTSIISWYLSESPGLSIKSPFHFAWSMKEEVVDDQPIVLQICNTAGQKCFQSISPAFYRDAQGALVVYDVTSRRSFEKARCWLDELGATMPESFVRCIVAKKVHREEEREVLPDDGWKFAAENNTLYQETSVLTGHGVRAAFQKACRRFLETELGRAAVLVATPKVVIDQTAEKPDRKAC